MTTKFLIFNFKFLILTGIVFIAIFFRFFLLGNVPPSASLDEASVGWNAYSILKTGGDEYGSKFPLLLRAYDDWRPALYAYTVIPFVQIFDLNVVSVRLPSVILSVLTVVGVYFLVRKLFGQEVKSITANAGSRCGGTIQNSKVEIIALFSTFLLAISPWHIYISRLGHEANL